MAFLPLASACGPCCPWFSPPECAPAAPRPARPPGPGAPACPRRRVSGWPAAAVGPQEGSLDLLLQFLHHRQPSLDFGDDAVLFSQGGREPACGDIRVAQVDDCRLLLHPDQSTGIEHAARGTTCVRITGEPRTCRIRIDSCSDTATRTYRAGTACPRLHQLTASNLARSRSPSCSRYISILMCLRLSSSHQID